MRPYSLDLRERIVAAVSAGQNQSEVARRFALSASSVSRYVAQQRRCQNLAAKPLPGAKRRLDESTLAALTERVQKQPDATLLEHQQWLHEEHHLDISVATPSSLAACRFHAQKKSVVASERDETKRAAWRADLQGVSVARLKFIDESGCHLSLTRSYGWALRSERCLGRVPGNSGQRQSIVALFDDSGMRAYRTQKGSLKSEHFERFVEEQVVPHLQTGDIVVVDNARCHQSKRTRELIEATGARLLFLPAYSPDLAPIELAWRQVKAHLRRVGARESQALQAAITEAMETVTATQARSFFTHCGYPINRETDQPAN
jgi:transposase